MKLRLFSSAFLAALLLGCVKAQAPQEIDDDLDMIDSIDYIDEYGVNHGPGIKVGIHIWSPVNCGYHATDYKYGKLYQWGRLYGQGFGDDATVPTRESGAVSLEVGNDKSNANVIFEGSYDSRYDWLSPQNHLLWNSGPEFEPVKTEFDPCPDGCVFRTMPNWMNCLRIIPQSLQIFTEGLVVGSVGQSHIRLMYLKYFCQ